MSTKIVPISGLAHGQSELTATHYVAIQGISIIYFRFTNGSIAMHKK